MNLKLKITIFIAKLSIKACRLLRSGGTTLPGKIAYRLYPGVINMITKDFRIIMVTGTNGKTTTSRIIGRILEENGIPFITNKSGANLVSGIITTFINSVGLNGKSSASTALIEIDEAAFNQISNYIQPDILVVTNFFRDQLDRYGELYSTLNGVRSGISRSEKAKVVLNADDSLCASLGKNISNEVAYYGFDDNAVKQQSRVENSDAMCCIYCKARYEYSYHIYGHLGGFSCPECGYSRPDAEVACTEVNELTSSHSSINLCYGKQPESDCYTAGIKLPGLYNIYNALAAAACGHCMGLPAENTIKALDSFECGFGRMETINTDGKIIKVILVKNPTGFNQVLNFLVTEDKNFQLALLINDNLADGTDISWLWDVDFESLNSVQGLLDNIYTSGSRAEDMAVRLKYAGLYADKISIVKDYDELISNGLSRTLHGHCFYILPTYTAMLDVRKLLKKKFRLKEFWR